MPELLTPQEVAERLVVSSDTVRRWARDGKLRHVTLPSGLIRVPVAAVDELLAQASAEPTEAAS